MYSICLHQAKLGFILISTIECGRFIFICQCGSDSVFMVFFDRLLSFETGRKTTILDNSTPHHFRSFQTFFEQAVKATGCESFSFQLISSFLRNNFVSNFQLFLLFPAHFWHFYLLFCLCPLTPLKLLCCWKTSKFEILAKSLWSAHNFHI